MSAISCPNCGHYRVIADHCTHCGTYQAEMVATVQAFGKQLSDAWNALPEAQKQEYRDYIRSQHGI